MEVVKQLSKKEKKALAFRNGKGKKKEEIQPDLPEIEDLDAAEEEISLPTTDSSSTKKRKREKANVEEKVEEGEKVDSAKEGVIEVEGERKKKRQRGKSKGSQKAAALAEGKQRLVLFVGNLPFKITVTEIQEHFKPCGETPIVRILTPKPLPNATANQLSKTKGCCFIEFTLPLALQAALRLHEEELQGRKLNVELTAGGGGTSAKRTEKIVEKRKTLTEERERTKKNKAEREGTTTVVPEGKRWTAAAEPIVEPVKLDKNGKKVRDRRSGKSSTGKEAEARARKMEAAGRKASSGANSVPIG